MKFMKLGSKPDSFQTDGDAVRYVATELASDLVVNVGDVKFFLHKFPLLSKSGRLQKLIAAATDETTDEIQIGDIPGGPTAFETCAKFCYGMTVTLNAYNVVAARCAAEYLEMYESSEKGNLIYKIEVFLNSSILRSWKDSIIALQTTRSLHPWCTELKIVGRCLESIASKASLDPSRVDWSYTYNRTKLPTEDESHWNGVRKQPSVPKDWWVEDLCELQPELYKRAVKTIKSKGLVPNDVIGQALHAYAIRRVPGFGKGVIQSNDIGKHRMLVETIVTLLPSEKGSAGIAFLLRLLRAAILLECGESERNDLMGRISMQLDEAAVPDLLFRAPPGETTLYDVETFERLVLEFVRQTEYERARESDRAARVVKLVDGYIAEVARDPNLSPLKFISLASLVNGFPRPTHDGLYRAIDMYLKEHSEINKSDRKKICKLMDCGKLSAEACMHAVQNERLPLRVVVQVLFFEQIRASTSSGGSSATSLPGSIGSLLPGGSHGSSRSISATTNTEDDWDGVPTAEELKALKGQLAAMRLNGAGNGSDHGSGRVETEKAKAKGGLLSSKIFSRLFSGKDRQNGELSSSDTSDSPGSVNNGENKSTPSRSRRQSLS